MYIYMYICLYVGVYICIYICMYVCMFVYMCLCMYVIFKILFTACSITHCNITCLRDHIHVYRIYILSYCTLSSLLFIFIRLFWSCSKMTVLLYGTSLWCSNILLFLVVRNTDYAQIGLSQFFIVYGVRKMDDLLYVFFH